MARIVLIGGITGGLGSSLARRLRSEGAVVGGFARDASRLAALEAELPGIATAAVDATDPAAVRAAIPALAERLGGLDGYAHAVGSIVLKPAHLLKDEEWSATLRLNLDSAFYALRAVVPILQARPEGGSVVLVSSVAARTGLPNHEAIAAAKAGVEGLARAAAATYAPRRVRVNAVAPGLVDTPLASPLLGSDMARKVSEAMHPLGRVGSADEVASLVAWLLSADACWVTGQCWGIDGGMGAVRGKPKV